MELDFAVTQKMHVLLCADRECIEMNERDSVRETPRVEYVGPADYCHT
jgi:hypothetical protein